MAVSLQVKVRGRELSLRPIGCTPALYVTQKCCCSCCMRLVALYKFLTPVPMSVGNNFWLHTVGLLSADCGDSQGEQSAE